VTSMLVASGQGHEVGIGVYIPINGPDGNILYDTT